MDSWPCWRSIRSPLHKVRYSLLPTVLPQLAAFPLHGARRRCKFHCMFHVIQVLLCQPRDTSHVKGLFNTSKYSHCQWGRWVPPLSSAAAPRPPCPIAIAWLQHEQRRLLRMGKGQLLSSCAAGSAACHTRWQQP